MTSEFDVLKLMLGLSCVLAVLTSYVARNFSPAAVSGGQCQESCTNVCMLQFTRLGVDGNHFLCSSKYNQGGIIN